MVFLVYLTLIKRLLFKPYMFLRIESFFSFLIVLSDTSLKGIFHILLFYFLLEDLGLFGVKKSPLCNFAMDLIKLEGKDILVLRFKPLNCFFTVLLFGVCMRVEGICL